MKIMPFLERYHMYIHIICVYLSLYLSVYGYLPFYVSIYLCTHLYLLLAPNVFYSMNENKSWNNQTFHAVVLYFHFHFLQNATSFINDYRNLLQQPQYQEYREFGIAGAGYDAMWSIAIGLDIASKKITAGNDSGCENLNGELVPLEMFDYRNEKLGCIMRKSFDEIMFTGITVSFNFGIQFLY